MDGEKKTCPVCDSEIAALAERCEFCDTDLSLFDFEGEGDAAVDDLDLGTDETIDQLLADIVGGAEGKEDVLEGIKSLGRNGPAMAEPPAEQAVEREGVMFECPNCGESVAEDAASCPGCGVEFAEEAAQFECPVCNNPVDANAASCPACGVEFAAPEGVGEDSAGTSEEGIEDLTPEGLAEPSLEAATAEVEEEAASAAEEETSLSFEEGEAVLVMDEEAALEPDEVQEPPRIEELGLVTRIREARLQAREAESVVSGDSKPLYNELPRLVADVKPMLVQAKKLGIEIGDTKELINRAISAGKARDIQEAVRLVKQSKSKMKDYFALQLAYRIESFHKEVMEIKVKGGNTEEAEALIKSAVALLEGEHYDAAFAELDEAKEAFANLTGGYYEASKELKSVKGLLDNAKQFDMDVAEAATLLGKSEDALEKQEWDVSTLYAKQARDRVLRELPARLRQEMKDARAALMDLKVRGQDLSKPIGILKRASISLKKKDYGDALKFVMMFRDEVSRATLGG